MSEIGTERPELLARFAKDHGGMGLMGEMAGHLDPRRAFEVFGSEPGIPPAHFISIAARGAAVDPEFIGRLEELPDGPAKDAFRAGVMETQLEAGRWTEAVENLKSLEALGPPMAKEFGEALSAEVAWIERGELILAVPEPFRDEAFEGAMSASDEEMEAGSTDASQIQGFLESMAAAGLRAWVSESIELSPADASAWGTWALELPEGGEWEALRASSLALWLANDESAATTLRDLPPGAVRETAMRVLERELAKEGEDSSAE
ncbi:hypothetical protein OKA05_06165 [Luteolibacter arcticus]|uniref:Uncharacterized protein n=1 Tax=Luteolibacter arcticus TaxID=1581411 RepID=A0ABT3GEZ0_9BACT|nr:hypothetical protein [Luteolibacter arcticus]MCW1922129.1 hypothetical protein [Luteolibacter arcticus]